MIARSSLFTAALLFGSCGLNAGDGHLLHDPNLSLSELAKTSEANSRVFTSYNSNGPVRWNQGWPWKFDLTGIGWDQKTTVTAITRRHVVMANHYQRVAGQTAVFHDRDGRPHRRTILKVIPTSQVGLPSDVAVGLLDQPLPKSIRSYPLLETSIESAASLVGGTALITEQGRRLFFHQIRSVSEAHVGFQYDSRLAESKKKPLVGGDSGNPSFILTKGELALVETHTGGGPGAGPFYGSADMIAALRKIVAQLDSSYQLRTIGIDRKVTNEAEKARALMPRAPVASPSKTPHKIPQTNPATTPPGTPRKRVVMPPT